MKIWNEMISCDDAGFEELHRELRSCPGLYILDNVRMPETFGNCISSIEIRHYSPRVITLTCNPPPREYTGKDRKIRSWAQLGTAKFSGFAEMKRFLKSFRNDTSTEERNRNSHNARTEAAPEPPPQPEIQYDRESLTVPVSGNDYISIDKDKLIINIKKEIFGQDEIVEKIAHLVCNHLSTKKKQRPLSIFLYGPTGTGKSAMAAVLVKEINKMLKPENRLAYRPVDCTPFKSGADITRLTGAAPGYVGFNEPGVFSILEENPNTVFVFEEIEKALSNDITEAIMQAMETGRQETNGKTLRNGNTFYDLSGCIIFFTSNIELEEKKSIGFSAGEDFRDTIPEIENEGNIARKIGKETAAAKVLLAESGRFKKEIVSRMNAIMKFDSLDGEVIKDIAAKCIGDLAAKSHLLYVTRIETHLMQEFLNAASGEVEKFGVRSLRQEAEAFFNDALREFSHSHGDYTHVTLSGTLDNINVSVSDDG